MISVTAAVMNTWAVAMCVISWYFYDISYAGVWFVRIQCLSIAGPYAQRGAQPLQNVLAPPFKKMLTMIFSTSFMHSHFMLLSKRSCPRQRHQVWLRGWSIERDILRDRDEFVATYRGNIYRELCIRTEKIIPSYPNADSRLLWPEKPRILNTSVLKFLQQGSQNTVSSWSIFSAKQENVYKRPIFFSPGTNLFLACINNAWT